MSTTERVVDWALDHPWVSIAAMLIAGIAIAYFAAEYSCAVLGRETERATKFADQCYVLVEGHWVPEANWRVE